MVHKFPTVNIEKLTDEYLECRANDCAFKKGYMDKRIFDDPGAWRDEKKGLHNYLISEK